MCRGGPTQFNIHQDHVISIIVSGNNIAIAMRFRQLVLHLS